MAGAPADAGFAAIQGPNRLLRAAAGRQGIEAGTKWNRRMNAGPNCLLIRGCLLAGVAVGAGAGAPPGAADNWIDDKDSRYREGCELAIEARRLG
jgi:hypothetical protein